LYKLARPIKHANVNLSPTV